MRGLQDTSRMRRCDAISPWPQGRERQEGREWARGGIAWRLKLSYSSALFATYCPSVWDCHSWSRLCWRQNHGCCTNQCHQRLDHLLPIRVSKPMTDFSNIALPTCVLALTQSIGLWDQSEWLECVCVLEIVGDELRSRLIAEKKLTSVGVASLARQVIHSNLKMDLEESTHVFV